MAIEGETIMLQAFPVAAATDKEAEHDIAWLQQVLQGIRTIRAELNVSPGKPLDVAFQAGAATDRERLERFTTLLRNLGKVDTVHWLDDEADTAQYSVAMVADLKVLVSLSDLVDVNDELARLGKLLDREVVNLKKSISKLDNRRFIDNAPAAVVEQEHQRKATHETKIAGFKKQIDKLRNLVD